jgi:hypothetical protein
LENVEEPITTRTQQPYTPTEKLKSYKAAKLTAPCFGFVDASRSGEIPERPAAWLIQ